MDEACADEANGTESDGAKSGTSFWAMLIDTSDENYAWNIIDLVGFALLVFVTLATCVAIAWFLCRNRCGCARSKEDAEGGNGCACGAKGPPGPGYQGSPRGDGEPQAYRVDELAPKKRDKKKKKKQSAKSMVCKTVEYHTDGTVEETQLMLSDASETDFEHAVDIVAGQRHARAVDLQRETPPPPRNSKRQRNDARGRETDWPDRVAGRPDDYEMQDMDDRGSGSYDERRGSDDRRASDERRGYDGRRASDDRRRNTDDRGHYGGDRTEGDHAQDPCWDCNQ